MLKPPNREITLTPLMINNQLSFNKFPRFDHMITQWNKKNKKTELLRTVRWEILSAAHKKCFIFSVSALPLHCGRVDNNVSVGQTSSALQRQQYAMRLWQILHQRKDLNIITKVSMKSNLPCSMTCCWFSPMCSAAAASIRGEVVVKTKPNQSYSPCILQILLAVPLLFSAVIAAALSPPILRMLTTL